MSVTRLKKINIESFRGLEDVDIEFADSITVICGKNGTSKSSILGIAAQVFSFEKDYVKGSKLNYRQITGDLFKSQYTEHFRMSEEFDTTGSMKVSLELYDGYTEKDATGNLSLTTRDNVPRAVVRHNSTVPDGANTSRNFTHPVIFLSLKRLYPIASRDYKTLNFEYLENHKKEFIGLTNELLNRRASSATSTSGIIKSAVSHGDDYDHQSVSAGEDNAGQIILALMSFKKLQSEYKDYKGGLLLIDEADAGLFPAAQIKLLKILERECRKLNLQVVITSHSPSIIDYAYEQGQLYRRRYKTIYLSNTHGRIQVGDDWSWMRINADINTETIKAPKNVNLPKVNVYFEDKEASDFYNALMTRQTIKKFTKPLPEITLGCSNYIQLIKNNITEFSERSVICLDADQQAEIADKNYKTIVLLPGELPPDQLIFEFLYNLPKDNEFWDNEIQFTHSVFTNCASEVLNTFSINDEKIDLRLSIEKYKEEVDGNIKQKNKKVREVFKRFYKEEKIQSLVGRLTNLYNPWSYWVKKHPELSNKFLNDFKAALNYAMNKGYTVNLTKLEVLKVKLKQVTNAP
ncbi:ATP-dependent nuclease [Marinospirillum minutulum]|uniref:ATP-dependent nuclease n=1 Tax=Marinospirillum minutulum TaxID=64974 RepID=UPI000424D299|nr:AAA family ATPase [Marinospirillum minutulum]